MLKLLKESILNGTLNTSDDNGSVAAQDVTLTLLSAKKDIKMNWKKYYFYYYII